MANRWKVFEFMKYMEGIFVCEEIDSLSNVLERDILIAVAAKEWLREVERQNANETSEQTEDRDHVGRNHVATNHRLTRSSSEVFTSRHRQGPSDICFCSVV